MPVASHLLIWGLSVRKDVLPDFFENLCTEGLTALFPSDPTPIGLAIGAVTTDEIAISHFIRTDSLPQRRLSLWKKNGILEQTNLDPVFLNALHTEGPKAIAVVVDPRVPLPSKPGGVMCVNALGQSFGTIGGGCGEHEALRKALEFSDKKDMFLSVDMTNDFAGGRGHGVRRNDGWIIRYVPGKVEI